MNLKEPLQLSHIQVLSFRELEVLSLIAYEYNNNEIAHILCLSGHTITTYRKRLLAKFDVRNSAGLIRRAYEYGLLPLMENKQDKINYDFNQQVKTALLRRAS